MKYLSHFLQLVVFTFAATQASGSQELKQILDSIQVTDSAAFMGWREKNNWSTTNVNPFKLKKVSLKCGDKKLYPSHPTQETKEYHVFLYGTYNAQKVPASSPVCKVKSNSGGNTSPRCLLADQMEFALISDTYNDRCGNRYRAYWTVDFLKKEETMGSLVSKGRTVYPVPDSQFNNDMIDGHTYAVSKNEFIFLTELLPGDEKKNEGSLYRSLQHTHNFDNESLLFSPK